MVFCAREHEHGLSQELTSKSPLFPADAAAVLQDTHGINLQVPLCDIDMLLSPFQSGVAQ